MKGYVSISAACSAIYQLASSFDTVSLEFLAEHFFVSDLSIFQSVGILFESVLGTLFYAISRREILVAFCLMNLPCQRIREVKTTS